MKQTGRLSVNSNREAGCRLERALKRPLALDSLVDLAYGSTGLLVDSQSEMSRLRETN